MYTNPEAEKNTGRSHSRWKLLLKTVTTMMTQTALHDIATGKQRERKQAVVFAGFWPLTKDYIRRHRSCDQWDFLQLATLTNRKWVWRNLCRLKIMININCVKWELCYRTVTVVNVLKCQCRPMTTTFHAAFYFFWRVAQFYWEWNWCHSCSIAFVESKTGLAEGRHSYFGFSRQIHPYTYYKYINDCHFNRS